LGNTKYLFTSVLIKNANLWEYKADGTSNGGTALFNNIVITTKPDTVRIGVELTNVSTGTFDFSKIQLYALSGAEGTINGTPTSARKQSRRTQYAKR
jgi:hypothetical protein